MRPPDPRLSRVVLIGSSRYDDGGLPDVAQVARNLSDLSALLTDPVGGVVLAANCLVLADEGDLKAIGRTLTEAAAQADDLLVVYFSGHGLVSGRQHDLYLALRGTVAANPTFSSLKFDHLRAEILESPARTKVVILDCCFSGRAVGPALAGQHDAIVEQMEVHGGYVLTSAQRDKVALVVPGEAHTAFTGRLLELLREGMPGGPEFLSINDIYRALLARMRAENLPRPDSRASGTAGTVPLIRNRAFARTEEDSTAQAGHGSGLRPDQSTRARSGPRTVDDAGDLARSAAPPGTRHDSAREPTAPARQFPHPEPDPPQQTQYSTSVQARPHGPRGPGRRALIAFAVAAVAGAAVLIPVLAIPGSTPLSLGAKTTPGGNTSHTADVGPTVSPSPTVASAAGTMPPVSETRVYAAATYHFADPDAIAVDGAHVWVANYGSDSVTELNASTGSLVQVLSAPGYGFSAPRAIAADGAHVWVANFTGNSVTELNASTGSLVQVLSVAVYHFSTPYAIADDGARVWVADLGGSVTELNAADGSLVRTLSQPDNDFSSPSGITSDGTHVWVANRDTDSVTELNADNASVVTGLFTGNYHFYAPEAIASDGTHVWVANRDTDSVTELNADNASLVGVLSAGYHFVGPSAITVGGTHVWVANGIGNSVTELTTG